MAGNVTTAHAIHAWNKRVDPDLDFGQCATRLRAFVSVAKPQKRPRRWTVDAGGRLAAAHPAIVWLYSADFPGVCGVVRNNTVATIVTRDLCRQQGVAW